MSYIGDFRLGDTFDTKFTTTAAATGAPTTLAGTPVISAYVGNSITQITAGITLTVDFDAVTGLHNVRVVATSGNGYATASNYQLVITTGTVGGTSAVGYVIGEFSIEARSAIMPTTAARTLDVSATGEAGVDWANVGGATTAVSLTNTTVATVTTAATATNVTTVNGLAANVITAASIAATAFNGKGDWNIGKTGYTLTQTFPTNFSDLAIAVTTGRVTVGTNADKTGYSLTAVTGLGNQTTDITGSLSGSVGSVTGAVGSVTGAVGSVTGAVGSVTGNVGGNVAGSVASVTARVTANTDQINGVATAAARLARSTQGIVTGTVGAASTTTSIVTSALDPAAAVIDQYKGRIVTFDQGTTTANLRGQSTDITASTALGVLTVTALTTAPVSGDTFVVT